MEPMGILRKPGDYQWRLGLPGIDPWPATVVCCYAEHDE